MKKRRTNSATEARFPRHMYIRICLHMLGFAEKVWRHW